MKKIPLFLALAIAQLLAYGQRAPDKTIRIPVIFHVIYSGRAHEGRTDGGNVSENVPTELLLSELADLHRDFLLLNTDTAQVLPVFKNIIGNPNVDFFLADTVLQKNGEKGIKRVAAGNNRGKLHKKSPVIHPQKYLNVYIGNIGGSYSPSRESWTLPELDGVYLAYDWIGQGYRLLTHEVGHWCGLLHIYGGNGGGKGNGQSCKDGDGIGDTPPQYEATQTNGDCTECPPPFGKATDKSCDKSMPSNYNNFMDYSGCRKMFTRQQAAKIRENLSRYRTSIWNAGTK